MPSNTLLTFDHIHKFQESHSFEWINCRLEYVNRMQISSFNFISKLQPPSTLRRDLLHMCVCAVTSVPYTHVLDRCLRHYINRKVHSLQHFRCQHVFLWVCSKWICVFAVSRMLSSLTLPSSSSLKFSFSHSIILFRFGAFVKINISSWIATWNILQCAPFPLPITQTILVVAKVFGNAASPHTMEIMFAYLIMRMDSTNYFTVWIDEWG